MILVLALTLSLLSGLTLGLLGGGGSILTVPVLVYALNVEPKKAIATSLIVVGITSLVGLIPHLRARSVRVRTGLVFGAAGMAGAYGAGRLAHFIPANLLLVGFGVMMLVTALAMMRGRKTPAGAAASERTPTQELPFLRVVVQGFSVGSVAGLVGAGGGFLVVPALVLLGGLPMSAAIGTSLVVVAMQSLAGALGYLGHVTIDAELTAVVTCSSVTGSVLGGRIAHRVSQERLRKSFAWLVIVMGSVVLARQIPVSTVAQDWTAWSARLPYLLLALLTPGAYLLGRMRGAQELARRSGPRPSSIPPRRAIAEG